MIEIITIITSVFIFGIATAIGEAYIFSRISLFWKRIWKGVFKSNDLEKRTVRELMYSLPSTTNITSNMVTISQYKEHYEDIGWLISELDKNEHTIKIKGHYNQIMKAYNTKSKDVEDYQIWKDFIIKNAEYLNNEIRQYNLKLNGGL